MRDLQPCERRQPARRSDELDLPVDNGLGGHRRRLTAHVNGRGSRLAASWVIAARNFDPSSGRR